MNPRYISFQYKYFFRTQSGNNAGIIKKRSLTVDETSPPTITLPQQRQSSFKEKLMASLKESAFPLFNKSSSVSQSVSPSAKNSTTSGALNASGGGNTVMPTTTNTTIPFLTQKSKFKMAHESFRIRMFQEQYGFEPVGLI